MTVYLVVVVSKTKPEARSQTVGVFGYRDEAEAYMMELESSASKDSDDMFAVETWQTGETRM